jgi:CDGSH-type Zn-finger protein
MERDMSTIETPDDLAAVIAGHEAVSFVVDGDRDWYRCRCGGTFGGRQWPSLDGRHSKCERRPEKFGPNKAEHIAEVVRAFLDAS